MNSPGRSGAPYLRLLCKAWNKLVEKSLGEGSLYRAKLVKLFKNWKNQARKVKNKNIRHSRIFFSHFYELKIIFADSVNFQFLKSFSLSPSLCVAAIVLPISLAGTREQATCETLETLFCGKNTFYFFVSARKIDSFLIVPKSDKSLL